MDAAELEREYKPLRNPLAHTPWWTTPFGLVVAGSIVQGFATEAPSSALVIGLAVTFGIIGTIALLFYVLHR